jgi:5-methylcytosine-specific restriction endonuclease McrA
MNVINQPVLVLNSAWQPIGTKTVKDAFIAMWGGEGPNNPPALGLDTVFPVDVDGNVDWNNPEDFRAVKWDEWETLPIRDHDLAIHSANKIIRVPRVIIQPNFGKMPTISPRPTKEAIRRRDGGVCQYTGQKLTWKEGNIDHVKPLAQGGKNTFENMVLCHKDVNSKKADRTPEQAGLKLLRRPYAPKSTPISATITVAHHPSWVHFMENVTEVRGATANVA